jgi:hypothetical protein
MFAEKWINEAEIHEPRISKEESGSVFNYTARSSDINSALFTLSGALSAHVAEMDKVFANKKNYIGQAATVYSGLHQSPSHWNLTEDAFDKLFLTFLSTSTILRVAQNFSHRDNKLGTRDVLEIKVPKGYPAISLKHYSYNPQESEVLLIRGTKLLIQPKPTKAGDTLIWKAKVLT